MNHKGVETLEIHLRKRNRKFEHKTKNCFTSNSFVYLASFNFPFSYM